MKDSTDVIFDSETGLFWFCLSVDGMADGCIAENRIEDLNRHRVPEGDNWRLPTLQELESLFHDAGITFDTIMPFKLPLMDGRRVNQVICTDGIDWIKFSLRSGSERRLGYRIWPGDNVAVWAVR